MTQRTIEIFVTLGQRLSTFGSDDATREVMARAIEQNKWFTEEDILCAIEAIRSEMLDATKLQQWISHYTPTTSPKRVAVIMAGNIPLVGFFDLLCVVASGNECHIKTSSKDTVLMRFIVDELKHINSSIAIFDYSAKASYDMVIATGGDDANRYFREHFARTRTLLRGSRHSIAILDGNESTEELRALMSDITQYSGMGCRSVSMIFAPRNHTLKLPHRTPVNPKLCHGIATLRALYTMQQREFCDCGAFLLTPSSTFPASLSEVALYEYDNIEEVDKWIADNRDSIQCVVSHMASFGDTIPLGKAQCPTLWDYADGIDTMKFLLE